MATIANIFHFSLLLGLLMFFFTSCHAWCFLNATLLKSRDSPVVIKKENGNMIAAMPSFMRNNYAFFNLTDQEIILACPGIENRFDFIKNNPANLKCDSVKNQTTFYIDGQHFKDKLTTCFEYLIAYENELNKTCYNGKGELFEIGFQIDFQHFYKMYVICYNVESGFSYFSAHTIEGFPDYPLEYRHLVRRFTVMNSRMSRKLFHIMAFMRRKFQFERLASKLEPTIIDKYFRGHNNFFTGVTLVPHSDFLVTSHQIATHVKANFLFLWKPRELIWRTLEYNIRLLARNNTLHILTGVLEQAKINNSTLYMGPRKTLPIHSYLWKFITVPKTKKCILFLMENFATDENVRHKCNLPCVENGWLKQYRWRKSDKKIFFCCGISEIKKILSNIPLKEMCTSVLKLD